MSKIARSMAVTELIPIFISTKKNGPDIEN